MAGNLSDYAENKILDHTTGKTSWTMPTIYVALYTTTPTDGTASAATGEVSGGSYARVATSGSTWNAASGGSTSNASAIIFPAATGSWGTVTAVALVDSSSGAGNIVWYGTLTSSKTVDTGDTFQFAASALTLSLN